MSERDYYPVGAYKEPNAPYNQVECPEIEVQAEVTVLLSKKNVGFYTNQYVEDKDGHKELIISYTYAQIEIEKQCNSIPNLLAELVKYINKELAGDASRDVSIQRKQYLEDLLADAQGWEQTDMEIENYGIAR